MNKLVALNKLIKYAYIFGHQVGRCWSNDIKAVNDIMEPNGRLRDEQIILNNMEEAAKILAPLFNIKPEELIIYIIKEGCCSEDWDYMPPEIAKEEKED